MSKSAAKPVVAEQPVVAGNYTITLHNPAHPGNRSSYTIPGRAGSVVIANTLFKDGKPPASLILGCEMVAPQAVAPKVVAPAASAHA